MLKMWMNRVRWQVTGDRWQDSGGQWGSGGRVRCGGVASLPMLGVSALLTLHWCCQDTALHCIVMFSVFRSVFPFSVFFRFFLRFPSVFRPSVSHSVSQSFLPSVMYQFPSLRQSVIRLSVQLSYYTIIYCCCTVLYCTASSSLSVL